jgi:methionine-rich copper-binding protein CopC
VIVRVERWRVVPLLAAACWLLVPALAAAHAHLQQSDPADGATIAAPAQFTLQFSEAARLTALTLVKVGQSSAEKITPLPTAAAAQLHVPAPRLAPGSYELRYRVISADGHIMGGSVHFTVAAH